MVILPQASHVNLIALEVIIVPLTHLIIIPGRIVNHLVVKSLDLLLDIGLELTPVLSHICDFIKKGLLLSVELGGQRCPADLLDAELGLQAGLLNGGGGVEGELAQRGEIVDHRHKDLLFI